MRSLISTSATVLLTVFLAQCRNADGTHTAAGKPTFSRDVAPILFAQCGNCHRPGLAAPFSVFDYRDVQVNAKRIASATSRRMPPWLPEPNDSNFLNSRRLRSDQIDTIQQWVKTGAPEGDPHDLPPIPKFDDVWQLGTPDLVLETPEAYTLKPQDEDLFRNFVVPIPLSMRRYVRGVEFRATNPKVVHHTMIGIDRTGVSRRFDRDDPDPGFDGMRSEIQRPLGHFLGWTPGKAPVMESSDVAWPLEPGSDLVIQLHMLPSTSTQTVRASVGMFFNDDHSPKRVPFLVKLGSKTIDIPAGEHNYTISDTYVLPVDVEAVSVYPHAHYLAREMKAYATLPGGTVKDLIWIKRWNFHWQDEYRYAVPLVLRKGTRLSMQFTYDNSADHQSHTNGPLRRVGYGPRSSDEMGDLWLQVWLRDSTDLPLLMKEYAERELHAEIAGAEQKIGRSPGDVEARNFLATRYMRAGRLPEAIVQLRAALEVDGRAADVHANLGIALQSMGDTRAALAHLRQAVELAPNSDRVHLHLGNALHANDDSAAARRHFRRAIALNPDSAEAHRALGVALGFQNQLGEALTHFRRALEITPTDPDTENNLGVALSLLGKHPEAITHFREALRLQPDHKDAQKNLAMALHGSRSSRREASK